MGNALNLGKVFGIQLRLHYSWFIIFVFLTILLVSPHWLSPLWWVIGIITCLLFFASVFAHELAHSLVARIYDIPVKSITLFIFGGIAQIAREATRPGVELKMAAAGPASSLVLGGLFFLLYLLIGGISEPIAAMALWLAQINVILAIFNLIPGFPLDGGRVFRSLLWQFTDNYQRSTLVAVRLGRGVGYLFILGGILIIFLLPTEWFFGLWLAFIGWFLENAASASYRQAQWRAALHGFNASQVMTSDWSVVPSNITVSQLVQGYIFTTGRRFFLVADDSGVRGILTLHNIKSVSQQNWEVTQVKEIMTPLNQLKVAHPNQDALSVLEEMDENDINQMPVVSEGKVIGLIARDNLIRFLRTRAELGV
ncbi:site-2 protease family protein [Dehalococcoidales bacterium]|nr:site-2 protease family protein [Dehalococcoidales bacterium]